jgi:RNA-directed DNA polymerase
LGNLQTPLNVQKLQIALHAKAKEEPEFRFYLLYDKIYRRDVLDHAYRSCKANKGAAGVDGMRFEDIEAYGEERWIGELAEELREKRYLPQAIRRVFIPKPSGGERPLGIPTVRDRVVQTAMVLVLSPIFEADFPPEQYGYRPGRSGLDAIREVHTLVNAGHREVIDADLAGYFDSIPHTELMKSVARRVSDRHVLRLIKQWLTAPVEEPGDRGRHLRTTRAKDTGRGVPQGAPISPLLSNLYMRRFILGWKQLGHAKRWEASIVNYADDFVICCRGNAEEAMHAMRTLMERLKLTVNETKTRRCHLPEESFDFLGYTIGRCWSPQTGRAYLGTRPSKSRIQRLCREISEQTERKTLRLDPRAQVARLNRILVGWSNYFRLGPVSKAYRSVDRHATERLRQWLRRKHKLGGRGIARFPDSYLFGTLGLVRLSERTRHLPWAKA